MFSENEKKFSSRSLNCSVAIGYVDTVLFNQYSLIMLFLIWVICLLDPCNSNHYDSYSENLSKSYDGTLYGDVYNWVDMIQNYIIQLAVNGIRKDVTQSLFDQAKYKLEHKDGMQIVKEISKKLGLYLFNRKKAALKIAKAAVETYDKKLKSNVNFQYKFLKDLPKNESMDSDNPKTLPAMKFNPYFKQNVSQHHSTIKIADEVPRLLNATIFTVHWTYELEKVMKENSLNDSRIRWQYFGSTAGVLRLYPGREWSSNFVGFYTDYDPRVRSWYITATSGPKDVIILIDCSISMAGEKFSIAKEVSKAVIQTLTKQDYVNVICARNSHWDEIGQWHSFKTDASGCRPKHLVPATIAHRKDLVEKIDNLIPGGTSELETGFELAFDLLKSVPRTGCQSIIIFLTDGQDTDGENVRCGPGYYTRSGYVPGPVCKYDWNKIHLIINQTNHGLHTPARIFSYLVKEDSEKLPGSIACGHGGSIRKITHGENIISQLSNYFEFLAKATQAKEGLWTSPYIDSLGTGLLITHAVPAISKVDGSLIGVAAVDVTLEEIEMIIAQYQWGSVTSFFMNNKGNVIFHPLLKANTALEDDPIFIQIQSLEQDKTGNPKEFSKVRNDMMNMTPGYLRINNGRRGTPKGDFKAGVKYDIMPLEYYYAPLEYSNVYSIAIVLADTDKVFRRLEEPSDIRDPVPSFFNLLYEYNTSTVLKEYPDVYKQLDVRYNESKYPMLRVTYNYSSIFFAPSVHCDPNKYFFDDDLAQKTLDAHKYMNNVSPDSDPGCEDAEGKYVQGTRAYVLITEPIENQWKNRNFESLEEVTWTYVGMRSGVFRTYPGHRSVRLYDPTKRPWYRRTVASPTKISISTPYFDAAGSGKIITISQAVFEGMQNQSKEFCQNINSSKPGGCHCKADDECRSGHCYISSARGPDNMEPRCATERIEAITSLDIGYDSFHKRIFQIMKASDGIKSCNSSYRCPNGDPDCWTRCYIFDDRANIIMASEFIAATALDTNKYKGITVGKKESEIMKDLIYHHKFFERSESIDFQGACTYVPTYPSVTLKGIPKTPEEFDNYYKNRGPVPSFSNSYGCIQDVVTFTANVTALGPSKMIVGNVSGPCTSGFYYVTSMPETNLFLLVVENRYDRSDSYFYNFNCEISRKIVASGAYRIINGTCAHREDNTFTLADRNRCPKKMNVNVTCEFKAKMNHQRNLYIILCSIVLYLLVNLYS